MWMHDAACAVALHMMCREYYTPTQEPQRVLPAGWIVEHRLYPSIRPWSDPTPVPALLLVCMLAGLHLAVAPDEQNL
jgi:hypothetical protein